MTTSETSPAPPPAAESRIAVVRNGDTGAAIDRATVAPVYPPSEVGPVITYAGGGFPIPDGATGVYVRYPPYGERFQAITSATPRRVVVDLYDPALQSPQYGDNTRRTRFNPKLTLPPPRAGQKPVWEHTGKALIEFPPVVWQGTAVFANNVGTVFAYDVNPPARRPQRPRWSIRSTQRGKLMAASPAIYPKGTDATVIVAGMDGMVNSYNLRTAGRRQAWNRPFSTGGSPIETSPLIVGKSVYVGDHNGNVYRLNADTGVQQCGYHASGAVKGSAAQYGDNIVFADYNGTVYSMRARDCTIVWQRHVGKRFYGGPGVSGSTIVLGDVGGAVYGISADTGNVLWTQRTGDMVYSSPAIADGVAYIGSYDHYLRALRLKDGKELWRFDVGGRISGSASVIGNTVYVARLAARGQSDATYAINTTTRKVVWQSSDGRYSPAVGAGRTLFIVGRTSLSAYRTS